MWFLLHGPFGDPEWRRVYVHVPHNVDFEAIKREWRLGGLPILAIARLKHKELVIDYD